jgi:Rod binding domain-containing protein
MPLAIDPQIALPQTAFNKEPGPAGPGQNEALRAVCSRFEAFFLQSMFGKMRDTVPQDGLIGHEKSIDWYREMMDREVAGSMAREGGIGLADMLYRSMQSRLGGEGPQGPKQKGALDTYR